MVFPIMVFSLVSDQSWCPYMCSFILLIFLLCYATLMMMEMFFLSMLFPLLMYSGVDMNNVMMIMGELNVLMIKVNYHRK